MLELDIASKPQHPPWGPRRRAPSRKLDVSIPGPLTIRRGTKTLGAHELGGPKPRQILEILLLHLGAPVSKGRLINLANSYRSLPLSQKDSRRTPNPNREFLAPALRCISRDR
ncbi:hypothetical protein [Arthrobacter sp. Y81]|uniref:hypothetical protein n=1 Tax=Arthrobacter sp. Y81 TaxID=2058897 RepID=UPI001CA5A496|nr:hypothetical protein [Arthrobacter sp. Y81]